MEEDKDVKDLGEVEEDNIRMFLLPSMLWVIGFMNEDLSGVDCETVYLTDPFWMEVKPGATQGTLQIFPRPFLFGATEKGMSLNLGMVVSIVDPADNIKDLYRNVVMEHSAKSTGLVIADKIPSKVSDLFSKGPRREG